MQASDLIALGALAVAFISWYDARRRIAATEAREAVRFTIVKSQQQVSTGAQTFVLLNAGTQAVREVAIDPSTIWPATCANIPTHRLASPMTPISFDLVPDTYIALPDSVDVTGELNGKPIRRTVLMPHVNGSGE